MEGLCSREHTHTLLQDKRSCQAAEFLLPILLTRQATANGTGALASLSEYTRSPTIYIEIHTRTHAHTPWLTHKLSKNMSRGMCSYAWMVVTHPVTHTARGNTSRANANTWTHTQYLVYIPSDANNHTQQNIFKWRDVMSKFWRIGHLCNVLLICR